MLNTLPSLPKPLEGVAYALTVPQSVLFADLSFRGCLSSVFQRIFGINYEPNYIVVDDGAMRWDYSNGDPFNKQLSSELEPVEVAQKFITVTARTARRLIRTAQIVSSPSRWRNSHLKQDLLEDLDAFWNAYEDHMSSLYTFWNVENLLTDSLIDELNKSGMRTEVETGLPTFIVPAEPNWFALEQQNLAIIKSRFADSSEDKASLNAASRHADEFGFLLAPFNLGTPPTGNDVVARMKQLATSASVRQEIKPLDGLSKTLIRLGELERELTFWKTERLDAFALADQFAAPMYKTLSELLELPLDLMFSMTRDELTRAVSDVRDVQIEELKQRSAKYCLALIDGVISFYQPTDTDAKKDSEVVKSGDVLQGLPTSPGVVRGRVRILSPGEENPVLVADEIIVTRMTRPELGAALDVALAYVTDEGGRLCHAAIVSREKKKPCVVALGNVTEVLRPGMLIEVDGSAGTVTIVDASFLAK
jgi:phosphoenolpyruvate synthase/pyruvate phosphate dikinase